MLTKRLKSTSTLLGLILVIREIGEMEKERENIEEENIFYTTNPRKLLCVCA